MSQFPALDPDAIVVTRDALHAYARILGDWLKVTRAKRKHWWHASLRPSLTGLTTGVIHSNIDFEIELNLRESAISVHTSTGERMWEELHGRPAAQMAAHVRHFLESAGVSAKPQGSAAGDDASADARGFAKYSGEEAIKLALLIRSLPGGFVLPPAVSSRGPAGTRRGRPSR